MRKKTLSSNASYAIKEQICIGNRIPKDFFCAKGHGHSGIINHAGSFHLALKSAGIEMCNIMMYSSILPGQARQLTKPKHFVHGEVMETIMAIANTDQAERVTAGIIYGWLYDKKTKAKYGGLVCEHNGNYSVDIIRKKL